MNRSADDIPREAAETPPPREPERPSTNPPEDDDGPVGEVGEDES